MRKVPALIAALLAGVLAGIADAGERAAERAEMVRVIERHAATVPGILGAEGIASEVLEVMRAAPRHLFVPEDRRHLAYEDRPVAIGHGQTISQPFVVALMTHLAAPRPGDTVLEIGTGSGYQAAVLSPLVGRVCTIEIIPALGETAAARLAELGYANVEVRIADGYHGWPECGPFDAIVVTAAIDHVPPPLVAQLGPGGRMVLPVGGAFATQHLTLVEKDAAGEVRTRQLLPVRFVPFVRGTQ
ncbi:MAG TPA: protein-L-isoaspartate(D-aspartate) O-methyltransferase [Thermohalobaculum sp.]|nr:protein-L-isoaspartate(D-aspartate) O-methyltransferase [Thermohalobaculum sp.]